MSRVTAPKKIKTFRHREASRKNIPTAEHSAVVGHDERSPLQIAYKRRNRDLDPQLVWRGKDEQDREDLIAQVPPLFIQEKVHPKVLIDDLVRHAKNTGESRRTPDLFADFNGLPSQAGPTEFYKHDANWSNRMILGDSLHVMASLAEREDLRGKVQCIFFDPPYGIKFNSNFQWSTTSRDVKDGNRKHITREPEQVKAFRDTWRDGIHSYLAYLRDRFTVARDLLSDSGSVFVQIGDENVHRVRTLMDEVFGEENFVSMISYAKTTGFSSQHLSSVCDYLVWYCRSKSEVKFRAAVQKKVAGGAGASKYRPAHSFGALSNSAIDPARLVTSDQLTSQGAPDHSESQSFSFNGTKYSPPKGMHWKTKVERLRRLDRAGRLMDGGRLPRYIRCLDDYSAFPRTNVWPDVGGVQSRTDPKVYVVQTSTEAVQRCILMTTDPGDLVLDPTCGSGTSAYVAEQWGRRWITIDTSRVALALARARIMGARYPYYLLVDSTEGQRKEAEVTRKVPSDQPTWGRVRLGFVYERIPHITLKQIATNAEIDVIWNEYQKELQPLLRELNNLLKTQWREWEVPRVQDQSWSHQARTIHKEWWRLRMARQTEVDSSIAANAPFQYLYDRPYEDKRVVRVAGPFTVESLSPHRVLGVGLDDEVIGLEADSSSAGYVRRDYARTILDQLRTSGIQQDQKVDRIEFNALTGWPGKQVCAVGQYVEQDRVRRAGILIGPEFGTVSRPDLVAGAREAAEAGFDALIACAFNYDAQSTELGRLGNVPIIKARMNADLHMTDELKNTGKGNMFVVFGEPDIVIHHVGDTELQVEIKGIDIFHPSTGEIRSHDTDGIACWFVDTDYNEESFFVRHAYFLGSRDPYTALKNTLRSEIKKDTWATLHKTVSRPFSKPESGRVAVKVINHLGDEAMRVLGV